MFIKKSSYIIRQNVKKNNSQYFSALRLNKGYDKMNSVTKKNADYFWSDSIKREITFSYGM